MQRLAGPVTFAVACAGLLALLLHAYLNPDLPQFTGKAMAARLALFPLAALLVPVGWLMVRRRQPDAAMPWAAAVLVVIPFVVDLVGNAGRLYVEVERFDDAVHFANPVIGVAAIAMLLDRTPAPRWSVVVMAFGLGCAAHICFELIEYVLLMEAGAVELGLTLRDTLSDLAWGLGGALLGSLAVLLRPRHR